MDAIFQDYCCKDIQNIIIDYRQQFMDFEYKRDKTNFCAYYRHNKAVLLPREDISNIEYCKNCHTVDTKTYFSCDNYQCWDAYCYDCFKKIVKKTNKLYKSKHISHCCDRCEEEVNKKQRANIYNSFDINDVIREAITDERYEFFERDYYNTKSIYRHFKILFKNNHRDLYVNHNKIMTLEDFANISDGCYESIQEIEQIYENYENIDMEELQRIMDEQINDRYKQEMLNNPSYRNDLSQLKIDFKKYTVSSYLYTTKPPSLEDYVNWKFLVQNYIEVN